jgi:hypothetical protein
MKTIYQIMLVAAIAGNSIAARAQDGKPVSTPEYYAVYERAHSETSRLGIHPTGKIHVARVEAAAETITVEFAKPVNGPAIINIYDSKGTLLLNQYAELNGTRAILPVYAAIGSGTQFLHVFTESAETIYQFKNNQHINN